MTAVTHDLRFAAASATAAASARSASKGIWERVLDRLYESRMRQVEREIRAHIHLIPDEALANTPFKHLRRYAGNSPVR